MEDDCVYFNNHLVNWYKCFCNAHEIGHHRLHQTSVRCTADEIESRAADGAASSAIEKIIDYGAGTRREREANLFALELLLPCRAVSRAFSEQHLNAHQIAARVEMPFEVVAPQLAHALLVPTAEVKTSVETDFQTFTLNNSQRRAAETANCPTLVSTGPAKRKP